MTEKERIAVTPENIAQMGYNPDVVAYFDAMDPDLLKFMWGNGSALYESILKDTADNERLISAAETQIKFQGRFGNTAASCELMLQYRLDQARKQEESKYP